MLMRTLSPSLLADRRTRTGVCGCLRVGDALRYMVVLIVTLTLFALAFVLPARAGAFPTTATVRRVRVQEALAWMRTQQRDDGSFGSAWGLTADAVYVIALAGEDPGGAAWARNGTSVLDGLALMTPAIVATGDGGQIAKVLRAVVAAGRDPRAFAGYDLVAELQRVYDPASGRYHPGNNFRQALAVQALAMAGAPVPQAAVQSLLDDQRPDGGWGWPYGGTANDVDTTGLILETLATVGVPGTDPHVQAGLAYLRSAQNPDGGWGLSAGQVSNCNSTALAIRALVAYGQNPAMPPYTRRNEDGTWRDALGRLLHYQQGDGGFRYTDSLEGARLLATTDAIPALTATWPGDHDLARRTFFPLLRAPYAPAGLAPHPPGPSESVKQYQITKTPNKEDVHVQTRASSASSHPGVRLAQQPQSGAGDDQAGWPGHPVFRRPRPQ